MYTDLTKLMRLDKPVGTLLLLWPTMWALSLASAGTPSISHMVIFVLGTFVMRSAGCVINDYTDIDIDRNVKRTKDRALVLGSVSKTKAKLLIIALLVIALALVSRLNTLALLYSVLGLLCTFIYPWLKRVTNMVQLFLGITFAMGIPIAYAAVTEQVSAVAWLIYLITIIWIVAYDTLYAMVDREDDRKIGVYSTAILFGNDVNIIIAILQTLVIIGLIFVGYILELGAIFQLSVMLATTIFIYQQWLIKDAVRNKYFQAFKNNQWIGLVIFIGIMLGSNNVLI